MVGQAFHGLGRGGHGIDFLIASLFGSFSYVICFTVTSLSSASFLFALVVLDDLSTSTFSSQSGIPLLFGFSVILYQNGVSVSLVSVQLSCTSFLDAFLDAFLAAKHSWQGQYTHSSVENHCLSIASC